MCFWDSVAARVIAGLLVASILGAIVWLRSRFRVKVTDVRQDGNRISFHVVLNNRSKNNDVLKSRELVTATGARACFDEGGSEFDEYDAIPARGTLVGTLRFELPPNPVRPFDLLVETELGQKKMIRLPS